jgi:hypothetical protein
MILQCDCQNEYQDRKYGKGMRVHNQRGKTNNYRCSICLKDKAK